MKFPASIVLLVAVFFSFHLQSEDRSLYECRSDGPKSLLVYKETSVDGNQHKSPQIIIQYLPDRKILLSTKNFREGKASLIQPRRYITAEEEEHFFSELVDILSAAEVEDSEDNRIVITYQTGFQQYARTLPFSNPINERLNIIFRDLLIGP